MRTVGRKSSKPKVRGKKAGRKILRLVAVLIILAAAAFFVPRAARAAVRYVCRMPLFTIKQVRVEGLKYVREDDFIGFVGDPKGESVLSYDMKGAMEKIGGHPWIKSGLVRREFPDEVRFELTERVPAAVVQTGAGKYLMDADGFALAQGNPAGLGIFTRCKVPVIAGPQDTGPEDGWISYECLSAFQDRTREQRAARLRECRGMQGRLSLHIDPRRRGQGGLRRIPG